MAQGRPKGLAKTGGGSRKGIPNKKTAELKDMVFGALHAGRDGGQKWLQKQRDENPVAFMTLLGKFVPRDVNVGGQPENPIITKIELVPLSDSSPNSATK
jgi:hypothetical protein